MKNKEILFSVVIPLYNKGDYILDCVNSVLSQEVSNYEIIIVNDGSTDNSLSIVETISHDENLNFRVFTNENHGVSHARNFGAERAIGKYICFLDADDVWHYKYLAYLNDAIYENPSVAFLATNYDINNEPKLNSVQDIKFKYVNYILDKVPLCSSSVCIRKDILCDTFFKFDLAQTHAEDTDVWFRLSVFFDVFYTEAKLAFYKNLDVNSATNSIQKLNNSIILSKGFCEIYSGESISTKRLCLAIEELRVRYFISCVKRKNFLLCFKHIKNTSSFTLFLKALIKKITMVIND